MQSAAIVRLGLSGAVLTPCQCHPSVPEVILWQRNRFDIGIIIECISIFFSLPILICQAKFMSDYSSVEVCKSPTRRDMVGTWYWHHERLGPGDSYNRPVSELREKTILSARVQP